MAANTPSPEQLATALKQEALHLGFDLVGIAPAVAPSTLEHFACDSLCSSAARSARGAQPGDGGGQLSHGGTCRTRGRPGARVALCLGRRLPSGVAPAFEASGAVSPAVDARSARARSGGYGAAAGTRVRPTGRPGMDRTARLACDEPLSGDPCGDCRACLEACPGGALVAPFQLDARRCLSYLTVEHRGTIPAEQRVCCGQRVFGCDTCQEVCPHNQHTPRTHEPAFAPLAELNPASPADWLQQAAELEKRFETTPLRRAGRAGLLRNAAVVLANRPAKRSIDALRAGLDDPEPTVRATCAWALGRLGGRQARTALEARLACEPDAAVRAELTAAMAQGRASKAR